MERARRRVGIIGAMDTEVCGIVDLMSDKKEEHIGRIKFFNGVLCGQDCIISASGVGKVYAAACTEAMIIRYRPELIVNIGIAGSLSEEIKIHDIVVATSVIQYDLDKTALGQPIGFISSIGLTNIPCCEITNEKIISAHNEVDSSNVFSGVIASGDSFIADNRKKLNLFKSLNAVACDMECASIGQVCYINDTKFSVIRKISDTADVDSLSSYKEFEEKASEKLTEIIQAFLKSI